jgi:hypothetical protein
VRGAFFDSVADRVTDGLVLGGMAWYLQDRYHGHAFALPLAVLGFSLLISYQRAKAESLGFDAKGGIMERAERVVVLCAALAFSVAAVPLLWVMLVLTAITAVQRFVKVWRQATAVLPATQTAPVASASDGDRYPVAADPVRTEPVDSSGTGWPDGGSGPPVGVAPAAPGSAVDPEATAAFPATVSARWRAWREASGWTPRTDRFARGTRRSSAGERWRERRRSRSTQLRQQPSDRPVRGRSGSRRP